MVALGLLMGAIMKALRVVRVEGFGLKWKILVRWRGWWLCMTGHLEMRWVINAWTLGHGWMGQSSFQIVEDRSKPIKPSKGSQQKAFLGGKSQPSPQTDRSQAGQEGTPQMKMMVSLRHQPLVLDFALDENHWKPTYLVAFFGWEGHPVVVFSFWRSSPGYSKEWHEPLPLHPSPLLGWIVIWTWRCQIETRRNTLTWRPSLKPRSALFFLVID